MRQSSDKAVPPVAAMVVHCCTVLQHRIVETQRPSGLVVGCGSGDEVVYMRHMFASDRILGIDTVPAFSIAARSEGCVAIADAANLPLPSDSFDFAAAFHSLEHVGDPSLVLGEVVRVLRPGAWFYMGVPNRSRLVGYLGSFDATTWQKITWNLIDWKARLLGRFDNEWGAHAGFGRLELIHLLQEHFSNVELLTEEFVRFKYAACLPTPVLDFLLAPQMLDRTVASHYAVGQKPQ